MRVHALQRFQALWLIAAACLIGLSAGLGRASADTGGFNLTVSPLTTNLVAKPGQAVTTPIRVANTGTQAVRLKVSLMKFKADGTGGSPAISDMTAKDSYAKWASFSQTSFVAQPNVYNSIIMTIKAPSDAAFGYYYAVVFNQDNGSQPAVPSENKINGAVASLVLLDVQTAGEKRQLQVTNFVATKKLYQYLPATFDITVKNTGNVHVMPTGNVFIHRSGSQNFIGTVAVNDQQGTILPDSSRKFSVTWDDGFPSYQIKRQNGQIVSDKNGKPIRTLSWNLKDLSKLRFGHYSASLTLVYNDGTKDVPVNGDVSFWVIPWVPLLVLLVIIVLVGFGLFALVRMIVRGLRRSRPKKEA